MDIAEALLNPRRDVLTHAFRRLRGLQEALRRGRCETCWEEEQRLAPYVTETADALCPIRHAFLSGFLQWPQELQKSFQDVARFVDFLVDEWGWGWLVDLPAEERHAAIEARWRKTIEPTKQNLLLGSLVTEPNWTHEVMAIDEWADKARAAGLSSDLATDKQAELFQFNLIHWSAARMLGSSRPDFDWLGDEGRQAKLEFDKAVKTMGLYLRIGGAHKPWSPDAESNGTSVETPSPTSQDHEGRQSPTVVAEVSFLAPSSPLENVRHRDSLKESQRKLLDAALAIGAIDRNSSKSQPEIAENADLGVSAGATKADFNELRRRGLLETAQGRTGGTWLTELGRGVAQQSKMVGTI
jgi:hypothetical protein